MRRWRAYAGSGAGLAAALQARSRAPLAFLVVVLILHATVAVMQQEAQLALDADQRGLLLASVWCRVAVYQVARLLI